MKSDHAIGCPQSRQSAEPDPAGVPGTISPSGTCNGALSCATRRTGDNGTVPGTLRRVQRCRAARLRDTPGRLERQMVSGTIRSELGAAGDARGGGGHSGAGAGWRRRPPRRCSRDRARVGRAGERDARGLRPRQRRGSADVGLPDGPDRAGVLPRHRVQPALPSPERAPWRRRARTRRCCTPTTSQPFIDSLHAGAVHIVALLVRAVSWRCSSHGITPRSSAAWC